MKKRTLVCFLIFTLCVLYTSIPTTVFGQEVSLAEKVFDRHSETLQREDIQAVLPQVLEGLKAPNIQAILNPQTITLIVDNPGLLPQFAPDIDPKFATLLGEDEELQALLRDPIVQELLQDPAAIDELAGLLSVVEPPVVEPPVVEPPVVEPPVVEPPVVEPPVVEPPVVEPPVVEPPVVEPPVVEPPVVEPPVVEPPVVEPPVVTPPMPAEELPLADPFAPIMPTNEFLRGKSRLGGLSLNPASGRDFIDEIIRRSGLPLEADDLVDAIVDMVPKGFLPQKQIRQILMAKRLAIFENQARHLDYENFGNAITPNFADFAYLERSTKHVTRDSLQVYMRVPAKVGGVTFKLTGGRTVEGMEVTPDEFQADTIPYTFRLEEALAATNLPAWPSLNTQLFSSVTLRYSNTGSIGDEKYAAIAMDPMAGENGVVWEKEIGIPPGNTFYYFEVMLAEPVSFMTLDREAIAAMDPLTVTLEEVLSATRGYTPIEGWAMPDPRNLQMVDRGIIEALFTPDLNRVIDNILTSPGAQNIIQRAIAGQPINVSEFLSIATQRQQNRIRSILGRNANSIVTKFETAFDPMLASVFTVPRINSETESIWAARIDNIADNNYYLEAVVRDADGNPLDQIQEMFTVDTSAPEADIRITPGGNTAGYVNGEGIYVAAALDPSAAATLNIMGMPKRADIGAGQGYLFYQQIALDADGNPENSPAGTWMPLTVESTMLASKIWSAIVSRQGDRLASFLKQNAPQLVGGLDDATIQGLLATMTPQSVLALFTPDLIQKSANPFLKSLEPFIGRFQLTPSQAQLIVEALGATVDIVDHLVPVTFDASEHVVMPLMIGDYGIRAMGIDTLFNVGSNTEPARLRVVMPDYDKASVTAASIGDRNGDGDTDDPNETGVIFADTTENVKLTGAITKSSGHPIEMIVVQYQDASGVWQDIGAAPLMGSEFEIEWDVVDFDALVSASDTVMVRAVATNALGISDPDPVPFSINLDAENYPVPKPKRPVLRPEVLTLGTSFTKRNPDSGAPQGTITISAYTTAQLTVPEIASIRLSAGAAGNWEVKTSTRAGGREKWSVTLDTTTVPDTITKDNPGARNAALDNNQYTVRAVAIGADGTEWPSNRTARFSVDNVDDVPPVGPTNIVSVVEADGQPIEANEDGSYTVGGLISPVVFTVQPEAKPATYNSVNLVQTAEDDTETTTQGTSGQLEFTVNVGEIEDGTYTFHALAVDAAGNIQTERIEESKITVHIENWPAPEILAITVDPAAETNPDSGAPQGTITLNSYSLGEQTTPPITSMIFEVKRQDADDSEWKEVGTTAEGMVVTEEEGQELQQSLDFFTDLIYSAAKAFDVKEGETAPEVVPIDRDQAYQKWSVSIDTIELGLEDTIDAESPAAWDVSLDTNPYVVRAIAVSAVDGSETASGIGVKSTFSLDNVDDVAPLGPTNIVAVADVAGAIDADADGNYTVGGIVDETVPSPIATYTIEPTADPSTYASVKLVQVDADGGETMIDGEVGVLDITTDVDVDGVYMFHALAVDEFGNVQTDESPQTTVNVLNFRRDDVTRLTVTAVDGVDVLRLRTPPEPVPLRESLTVGFNVDNGSLDAEELSAASDESMKDALPSESDENPENTFSLKVDVSISVLPEDGVYTPHAVVTKRNGSLAFPLKTIKRDTIGPMVEIQTPSEDDTVDSLPTVHATYNDGEGSGIDDASGSLALARLHPPDEVSVDVGQYSLEKDETTLVYTRTEKLPGGAYRVTVQVADILGNVGEDSVEFAINGTPADTTPPVIAEVAPSGSINAADLAPSEFTKVSDSEALIKLNLSAVVSDDQSSVISVRFRVDDKPFNSVPHSNIKGNPRVEFVLGPGTHTATVSATSQGGTTEHSWTFDIIFDQVAPTITSITPTGTIRAGLPTISVSVNDESGVDEIYVVLMDSGGKEVKGDTEDDGERGIEGITRLDFIPEEPLDEGTYTIDVRATDTIGNSATAKGSFTIDFDTAAPVITMASPQNEARLTERRPQISITYADAESGVDVDAIRFVLDDKLINLKPNQKSASQVMYTPDIDLAFGQHTVKLEVSDMAHKEGNVSEKSSGAREANMAVHEFTFFVESEEGPVLASRPINAPNPFKENTRISFTLTRQSTVSIIIYDTTLRPVRVLVDNEVWDAGEYVGKGAIGWDGTTTAGEDLARGVYYCQIMVADGFEPEYAILKLALTR